MNLKQIINDSVHTDWKDLLLEIDSSNLDVFLSKQKTDLDGLKDIYPPEPLIFNAFNQFDKIPYASRVWGLVCLSSPADFRYSGRRHELSVQYHSKILQNSTA